MPTNPLSFLLFLSLTHSLSLSFIIFQAYYVNRCSLKKSAPFYLFYAFSSLKMNHFFSNLHICKRITIAFYNYY